MRVAERDARREDGKKGFIGRSPLVAGVLLAAALSLAPFAARAERAHRCSAKEVAGVMTAFESHSEESGRLTGLKLNVPLLQKNRYMQISVPDPYFNDMMREASKLSRAEQDPFVEGALKRTITNAVDAMRPLSGKRLKSATFKCGSLTEPPKAAPAKAPAQPAKAPKAPAKTDGTDVKVSAPLSPTARGGKGSQSDPYTIEIPVPHSSSKGSRIAQRDFAYTFVAEKTSVRMYFRFSFVSAKAPREGYQTSLAKLSKAVAKQMFVKASAHMKNKGVPGDPQMSGLVKSASPRINGVAQEHSPVSEYLGIEPPSQPGKRRRTIDP